MLRATILLMLLMITSVESGAQVEPTKLSGTAAGSLTHTPALQKISVQVTQVIQPEALVPDSTATSISEETRRNTQKMEAKPE